MNEVVEEENEWNREEGEGKGRRRRREREERGKETQQFQITCKVCNETIVMENLPV